MKMREEFTVGETPAALWEFFAQVERVARCVPGVEEVTVLDADNSRVRLTQSVGPMVATFDVKMRVTARHPGRSMEFTTVGRSVGGAAGNVRATNTVQLERVGDGTRVLLEGDVALGGMLGSVGQKVLAKQASKVAESFAEALRRELSGSIEVPAEAELHDPPSSGPTGGDLASGPSDASLARAGRARGAIAAALAGLVLLAAALLIARRSRSR